MRLGFDEETEAFRAQFVRWLEANLPTAAMAVERPRSSADIPAWGRAWQRTQFDAGWLVPGNPPEHGGRNASLVQQFVHLEEMHRRNVVASFNPQGLGIVVPSLLSFGTEDQKQRWAVPILRGDKTAALGMSEPGAGSDLAGLRTRAELRDGSFVINGQKVWTSGAHSADVLLVFVRTDPEAPKHQGISVLIVPTDTPGVTRRPFGSVMGKDDLDFNEVFFDDVVVPSDSLLGPLNGGWQVANGSLGHERAMLWLDYWARLEDIRGLFREAVVERAGLRADTRVLDDLAILAMDAEALKLLGYRTLAKAQRGVASPEQSILKLFASEAMQDALGRTVEWLGSAALDDTVQTHTDRHMQLDAHNESWFDLYLRSFAATIAGGTSEIQRNIVAERVLGLPRGGARVDRHP